MVLFTFFIYMLNDTFWLVSTPVWITWIKDTDVLHMMKCKTINPKLWSHHLIAHTASGLLPRHLKFKCSYQTEIIWANVSSCISLKQAITQESYLQNSQDKIHINSRTLYMHATSFVFIVSRVGFSQLSCAYDF